ncbi:MAG TPA: hypothetical protein VFS95_04570, partial [Telluria sp.]|nr:hypothetical protein [Telluria sp.]
VGILYYAYTYSYPSGKPLELWELALMFPREFVIVSFAAVVILLIVASWCIKLYKRVSSSNS